MRTVIYKILITYEHCMKISNKPNEALHLPETQYEIACTFSILNRIHLFRLYRDIVFIYLLMKLVFQVFLCFINVPPFLFV